MIFTEENVGMKAAPAALVMQNFKSSSMMVETGGWSVGSKEATVDRKPRACERHKFSQRATTDNIKTSTVACYSTRQYLCTYSTPV